MKQYVEGLSGEHARHQACRSRESAIAAEAFMNNAGQAGASPARFDLSRCSVYTDRAPATGLAVMSMALPVLHLNEIPQEGLNLSCDVHAEDLALGPEDGRIPDSLTLSARVVKAGTGVHVTGRLSGTVRRQCVRCLKEYDDALRLPIVGVYRPDHDLKSRPAGRGAAEPSGAEVEDDVYTYAGEEIVLQEMLREQVILAAPMQPLCSEECQGLCPVCGQDRNEQPCGCQAERPASPFSVLKVRKVETRSGRR